MSPVDIIIIVILLVSTLIGVFRGFVREVLSLASWIIAIFVAWTFAEMGATYLEPYVSQPPLRVAGAFVAIFIIVLIALSIISYLLYKIFALAGIGGVDRSLGALFGVARGVILIAALILGAVYMDFTSQPWWQGTKLVAYFSPVTDFMLSLMPENIVENFRPKVV
jgi:membrane protein required for colicin V production